MELLEFCQIVRQRFAGTELISLAGSGYHVCVRHVDEKSLGKPQPGTGWLDDSDRDRALAHIVAVFSSGWLPISVVN